MHASSKNRRTVELNSNQPSSRERSRFRVRRFSLAVILTLGISTAGCAGLGIEESIDILQQAGAEFGLDPNDVNNAIFYTSQVVQFAAGMSMGSSGAGSAP